jgi:hypothetical protein
MTAYTATLASPHCRDCTKENLFKETELAEMVKLENAAT